MKRLRRPFLLCSLVVSCLILLLAGGISHPRAAHADTPLAYGFEDGAAGFTAPSWLGANAGQPSQSADQASEGTHSLALPVHFTGGSFDQAGADEVIDNYNPVDLTAYAAVSFDVYAPVANVWADLVFNDPWFQPAGQRSLQVGWNTVTFDISPTSQDFPGAGSYFSTAKEFILRVVGRGVRIRRGTRPCLVRFACGARPGVAFLALCQIAGRLLRGVATAGRLRATAAGLVFVFVGGACILPARARVLYQISHGLLQ